MQISSVIFNSTFLEEHFKLYYTHFEQGDNAQ